jgi:dCTP deaminase
MDSRVALRKQSGTMSATLPSFGPHDGILPDHDIRAMVEAGAITHATPLDDDQVQPASLDLRLGQTAYRIKASFLPGAGRTVAERLDEIALHQMPLEKGAVLETGCIYLVELNEALALPPEVSAATNPKSSTGRLDIFTRVITDGGAVFDQIPAGYAGKLYLEIAPQSFPILVKPGVSAVADPLSLWQHAAVRQGAEKPRPAPWIGRRRACSVSKRSCRLDRPERR